MKVTGFLRFYIALCRENKRLKKDREKGIHHYYLIPSNSDLPDIFCPDETNQKSGNKISGGLIRFYVSKRGYFVDINDAIYDTETGELIDEEEEWNKDETTSEASTVQFMPGDEVVHKKYGNGIICIIGEKNLLIDFNKKSLTKVTKGDPNLKKENWSEKNWSIDDE